MRVSSQPVLVAAATPTNNETAWEKRDDLRHLSHVVVIYHRSKPTLTRCRT